jgi:hypothetical protein
MSSEWLAMPLDCPRRRLVWIPSKLHPTFPNVYAQQLRPAPIANLIPQAGASADSEYYLLRVCATNPSPHSTRISGSSHRAHQHYQLHPSRRVENSKSILPLPRQGKVYLDFGVRRFVTYYNHRYLGGGQTSAVVLNNAFTASFEVQLKSGELDDKGTP